MSTRNPAAMGGFSTLVSRHYSQAADEVFRAWTEPASIKAWLAGGKQATADVRVGGLFYLEMWHEGRIYPHYGRYLRIEPSTLLEFTWVSEGTRGKESVVTLEFTSDKGGTMLRLRHDGLPDQEMADSHNGGWSEFLDMLTQRLGGAA